MANWLNSFLFASAWTARKQAKAEKARQQFLRDRRTELASAITALSELISELTSECGRIDISEDFPQDMKLAMLYAFGEVLSAQGKVLPEQEPVVKLYLANLNPTYNYAQFTDAVIHRTGVYQEYRAKVGLDQNFCGSFWCKVFEMIYRTRLIDNMQAIDDQLSLIVINFAYLGDPSTAIAKPICDKILNSLNYHVNAYQQTPYIHALMLLQNMLLEMKNLSIEAHSFLRRADHGQNGRNYYVFRVYNKVSGMHCGQFAVREIKIVNGKFDFQRDGDQILMWNESTEQYEVFYQELP